MKTRLYLFVSIALLTLAPPALVEAQGLGCANISAREAEILIYLLPVGEQLRSEGMDIAWEREPKAEANRKAYVFWVINSKRTGTGSVTIGYYSVDKCSAAVTEDETGRIVTSSTLQAVQRILTRPKR